SATELCTVIGERESGAVATIEHLMSALYGAGVDNVLVEIDGVEVPILDGSAAPFVDAIDQVGVVLCSAPRRYLKVMKPVRATQGKAFAELRPDDAFRLDVEIDFGDDVIGRQRRALTMTSQAYRREVSRARTFGFMRDVERLWAAGYALGSSLENSVVISDDDSVINVEGLRYTDEFVRHKTLDAVGDLSLAGAPFIGCYRSYRGGHKMNANVLKALLSDPSAYEVVETATPRQRTRARDMVAVAVPGFAPWSA
ncbi:MAG: UDP-3-O-acyl-N-acetylglucosamine deacetylase, partial [Ensifer adhaerens]